MRGVSFFFDEAGIPPENERRRANSLDSGIRRNDGQKSSGHGGSPLQKTNFSFIGHGTISWEVVAAVEEARVAAVWESMGFHVSNPV